MTGRNVMRGAMVASAAAVLGLSLVGSASADPTQPCRDGLRVHVRVGGHDQPTTSPSDRGVNAAGVHIRIHDGSQQNCQTPAAPVTAVPAAPAPVIVLPVAPAPVIASGGPVVTH